jgi:hypothetical protein
MPLRAVGFLMSSVSWCQGSGPKRPATIEQQAMTGLGENVRLAYRHSSLSPHTRESSHIITAPDHAQHDIKNATCRKIKMMEMHKIVYRCPGLLVDQS